MSELKLFVLRYEAIKLYRAFLRAVKEAPKDSRGEILQQVRHGYHVQKKQSDAYAIKYALSTGRDQLKQLQEMLAMMR